MAQEKVLGKQLNIPDVANEIVNDATAKASLNTQYLNRNGGSPTAMLADLDMGGNAITNVGNVDGVDVSVLKTDYDAHLGSPAPANTHEQIDTHIANSTLHFIIDDTGSPVSTTEVWSASKVAGELALKQEGHWIYANNGADFATAPVAPGVGSISIGNAAGLGSPTINGTISIGEVAHARGDYSIAIGQEAVADSVEAFGGWASIAIGYQAITRGYENIAIGEAAQAGYTKDAGSSLTGTIAIGAYTNAYATDCTAVGYQAIASGFTGSPVGSPLTATDKQRATAFGAYATAKSQDSLALGANAIVGGTQGERVGGIAIGANADCRGTNSIALGYSTQTNLDYATTIGYNLTNTTASSVMIGQAAHGSPIETFYMLMSDNGVLTLSGAKAQFVQPNYAGSPVNLPVGVTGGTVYDTTVSRVKAYNGSSWVAQAPEDSPVFTGVPVAPTYTVGTLPVVVAGGFIYVIDATGFGSPAPTGSMCFGRGGSPSFWIDMTTGKPVV